MDIDIGFKSDLFGLILMGTLYKGLMRIQFFARA